MTATMTSLQSTTGQCILRSFDKGASALTHVEKYSVLTSALQADRDSVPLCLGTANPSAA
jgi:hypothetical protein